MRIKLENVGIAVRDLEAAIAFFTDLGLTVLGRDTVSGEWTDTAVGLDGNHANIAMLQTPDGNGRLELFEYIHPDAIETEPTRPNEIGMHRVAFSVDDIDEALAIAASRSRTAMPTFSSLMGMRCTLQSGRRVQVRELAVPAQPDKELSRRCAASGPSTGHSGDDPGTRRRALSALRRL